MNTALERSKQAIRESLNSYIIRNIPINPVSLKEITGGLNLDFDKIIHPCGKNLNDVIFWEYYANWIALEKDIDILEQYEKEAYAEILAEKYTQKTGGEWVSWFDKEAIDPFTQELGAWVVERLY